MNSQYKWIVLSLSVLFLSSCIVTKTRTTYHQFTNENNIKFDRELFDVDVVHQLDDQHMIVKMTNTSNSNYLLNWSRSSILLNISVIPLNSAYVHSEDLYAKIGLPENPQLRQKDIQITDKVNHTVLLPSGHVYEVMILLNRELHSAQIQLPDTSSNIDIETRFTFSEVDESSYYTNIYNLKRLGVSTVRKEEAGLNTLQTKEQYEKVSGTQTVKNFFQLVFYSAIIVAAVALDDE